MSRIRVASGRALVALGALCATLLAAELVARFAIGPQRYHSEPLESDPELGFRGIPGYRKQEADDTGAKFSFALNAQGLRGRAIPDAAAREGVLRIAFVGDSFLVGQGVPEDALLTSRVADGLAARGIANEVYNLSVADYGTGQELLLLRRFAPAIEPDLVVLAVYPHNDLLNNFEGLAGRSRVSPGDYLRPYVVASERGTEIRYTHPLRALLRRHSKLYALLERRALASRRIHPFASVSRATPRDRLLAGEAQDEPLELFRSHAPDHPWEQAWQRTFALIDALRAECAERSARLLVVVIPNVRQVERTAADVKDDLLIREIHGVPLDRWLDWNLPERRLSAFLRDRGIEGLPLLPALRQAAGAGSEVYQKDHHLNAAGHAIAARETLRAIAREPAPAPGVAERPVRLPIGADAPRVIVPGTSLQHRYLDGDWIPWQSEGGSIDGALAGRGALVAVPALGPELFVRGIAVGRLYPLDLELRFVSGPQVDVRIEKRGPFELNLAVPRRGLPTSDGYLALALDVSAEGTRANLPTSVIVRAVGFKGP